MSSSGIRTAYFFAQGIKCALIALFENNSDQVRLIGIAGIYNQIPAI
jgi:hypothetical protein